MPRGRPRKIQTPPPQKTFTSVVYKRPVGAPTMYTKDMGATLIHTFSCGRFISSFCAAAGIDKSTFHEWVNKYPEFAKDYQFAKTCGQAYYEEHLSNQATSETKAPNATQLMAIMNNQYKDDYSRNPQDSNITQNNTYNVLNISYEEINKRIEALLQADPHLKELEYGQTESTRIIDVVADQEADGTGESVLLDVSGDRA